MDGTSVKNKKKLVNIRRRSERFAVSISRAQIVIWRTHHIPEYLILHHLKSLLDSCTTT
jgi:hypothetical protein